MKVRSDILRVYLSLHTWVGICSGLLLFIGFFAGALTMFKQPLDRWISPPQQQMAQLDTAQLDALVPRILAAHPAARHEFTLKLQRREDVAAPMQWSEGGSGRELALSGNRWLASLDERGAVVTEAVTPSLFGELVDMLHRTGGIPGFLADEYLGVYVLGIAGVLYFLALVSGVILLLPTLVKDFFALRPGKNNKRFWLDAHNIVGITSLPFHIVISLTVIVFAFHDQFYDALNEVVYADAPMFGPRAATAEAYAFKDLLPPSQLIERVRAEAPGFEVTELLYMGLESPRPLVRAGVYDAAALVHGPITGYVGIHPYTGEITMTDMLPGKTDTWGGIVNYFFALHFGSFGGNLVRWIYFFLGLSGAFLFYSGNLLWIERRRKKARRNAAAGTAPEQPRNTRWMAAATVGICLGSVIGVCLALVAGKWASAFADNINHTYLTVYYSGFLLAVVFSCWRGAAAAWQLLLACAASCALIPLTSLAAVLLPGLGLWAHVSAAALGVDITGLAGALVFAWAARRSRRRALGGGRDSVWSAVPAQAGDTSSENVGEGEMA